MFPMGTFVTIMEVTESTIFFPSYLIDPSLSVLIAASVVFISGVTLSVLFNSFLFSKSTSAEYSSLDSQKCSESTFLDSTDTESRDSGDSSKHITSLVAFEYSALCPRTIERGCSICFDDESGSLLVVNPNSCSLQILHTPFFFWETKQSDARSSSWASSFVLSGSVYSFGGADWKRGVHNELLGYNFSSDLWEPMAVKGMRPPGRLHASVVTTGACSALLFGGLDCTGQCLDDLWEISVTDGELHWSKLRIACSSSQLNYGRALHCAVYNDRGSMYVIGGYSKYRLNGRHTCCSSSSVLKLTRIDIDTFEVSLQPIQGLGCDHLLASPLAGCSAVFIPAGSADSLCGGRILVVKNDAEFIDSLIVIDTEVDPPQAVHVRCDWAGDRTAIPAYSHCPSHCHDSRAGVLYLLWSEESDGPEEERRSRLICIDYSSVLGECLSRPGKASDVCELPSPTCQWQPEADASEYLYDDSCDKSAHEALIYRRFEESAGFQLSDLDL